MDRRRLIPLILLLTLLAVVAVAYSVAISLGSTDIDQLGATGRVSVTCPVSGCAITKVKWVLSGSPINVDKVRVYWTPADNTKTYTVYVELYTTGGSNPIASGSESTYNSGGGYTEVDVDNVDPRLVDEVRIIIVEA